MSVFSAEGRIRLVHSLEELYPDRGSALLSRLEPLADIARRTSRRRPTEFSSRDAILITYADMLHSDNYSPLHLLDDFLERRAEGLFSLVHILPFFPSSSDEGYSVKDYFSVDPRLGSWDDIERIGRRFGLVFDLVLNHASAQGGWFRSFLEGRQPYCRFFLTRDAGCDVSKVFRPRTHPLLTAFTRNDGSVVHVWTTFSADQVDLDFSEPEVLIAMTEVALSYIAHGATILRLDAIAYVWKEDGTNCLDRPQVHSLLRFFRALFDEIAPGVKLLSETNLPRAINDSYFGKGDEAHMVYNFPLPPLVLHAFMCGKADRLAAWAAGLPAPDRDRVYVNFLSSHDGIGVTPARDILPADEFSFLVSEARRRGALISTRSTPEGEAPYELNSTFLDIITEEGASEAGRVRAFLSAQALMTALSGIPAFWFHSLVGSRNWTEGPVLTSSKRSIHRERLDKAALERELEDGSSLRRRVYDGIAALLGSRSRRPAFDPDSPQAVLEADGSGDIISRGVDALCGAGSAGPVFGLVRGRGSASVLSLVNVSNAEAVCMIPRGFAATGRPFDPTACMVHSSDFFSNNRVILPPHGTLWLDGDWKGD